MNISLERAEGASAGKLIVNIEKADYQDKVTASLKKMKQKAQMPGFRKGMVPMGMIQKIYGNEVKAEELQNVLAEAVNKYINDEKLRVLGEPMLADDNEAADIAAKDDFEFRFDLAFGPEINVKLDDNVTVDYYDIEVDDDTVQQQIDMYRRVNGHNVDVDTYADDDVLKGKLTENDGEIVMEEVSLMPRFFANDEQKALFAGAKKDTDIVFCPAKAYEGRDAELASLLKLTREEAVNHTGDFTFHVNTINHYELGELNESLFSRVYFDGSVKTVEDFTARVKADLQKQFAQDSDYKFMIDLKQVAMKMAGEMPLAEDLLKKMVMQNAKTPEDKVKIEEMMGSHLDDLRWNLVRNELTKQLGVKIDKAELLEASKRLISIQLAQYGMGNLPEEQLEHFANERLKDEKLQEHILNNAIDFALIAARQGCG